MKRWIVALALVASSLSAEAQVLKGGALGRPTADYAYIPAPSGCVATSVPLFLGSPVAMGCDAGLTYDAETDTLTAGTVSSPTPAGAAGHVVSRLTFPLDAAAANYSTTVGTFANAYGSRPNQVTATGFNADGSSATEPRWLFSFESNYHPVELSQMSEWHLAWTAALPSTTAYRPISVNVNRISETIESIWQATTTHFRGTDALDYLTLDFASTPRIAWLENGMMIRGKVNNTTLFSQKNAAGDSYIELFKVNASDEVQIAPMGGVWSWTGAAHGSGSTASNLGVALGSGNDAAGNSSVAMGHGSATTMMGEVAQGSVLYPPNGFSQWNRVVMSTIFNAATDKELLIDYSYRYVMKAAYGYACTVRVVVLDNVDKTNVAAFSKNFAATRAGAANTALVNDSAANLALTEDFNGIAGMAAYVKADTTNGAISLWITPPSGNTTQYTATASLECVQIGVP